VCYRTIDWFGGTSCKLDRAKQTAPHSYSKLLLFFMEFMRDAYHSDPKVVARIVDVGVKATNTHPTL
jgi:hypothetical protein